MVDGDTKDKLFADEKETKTGFAACARGESLCDISSKDVLDSETCDRIEKPLSDSISPDRLGTTANININEMEVTTSSPSGSVKLSTSADCISRTNKLSKMDSSLADGKMKSTLQLNKGKTTKYENVQSGTNLSSKKLTKGPPSAEKLTKENAKPRSSLSNNGDDNLCQIEHKDDRFSSSVASDDHPSSSTGEPFVSTSKYAKGDGYHALPVKSSSIPTLPQSARNGLKTSMMKVVQQFRAPKQSKYDVSSPGSEIAGKHKVNLFLKYDVFFLCSKFLFYNFGIDFVCCLLFFS